MEDYIKERKSSFRAISYNRGPTNYQGSSTNNPNNMATIPMHTKPKKIIPNRKLALTQMDDC